MKPVLISLAFLSAVVVSLKGTVAPAAERPNVVWIMSEDNSKHYLRLFDATGAAAPNIEALARDGIVFNRAFSNSPVCSVARTTLITGCYAPRIGTQFHRHQKLATLPGELRMFPAYLRDAGYYTTNNRKEDYNAVKSDEVWDESSGKASWRNRPNAEQPFFHVSTFTLSHESSLHFPASLLDEEPTQTSPESVALAPYHPDTPLFRYTYARYHDRMALVDEAVGKVVEQLRADGLLEDTFIFYFGDHGGVLPRGKGYVYESGLHVPLVVRVPERWQERVRLSRGSRTEGFVEFVDFGPTVLHLAGVEIPEEVDGQPFLGPDVSAEELADRDETIGYADRFDEKYDLVRSLRQGRWKYIRNYEAFNPDGLQNNYRYKMLAYQQWRAIYHRGELNATQRQFFEPKAVEALYDLESDPYEIHNLAGDPQHADRLAEMRERLRQRLKAMPDLSFIPESVLVEQALDAPVDYGQTHADQIGRLIDTVDLSLLPLSEAKAPLAAALAAGDWMQRYWALVACLCHGAAAEELVSIARQRLQDPQPLVRVRAAQFLGLLGVSDPRPAIYEALQSVESPTEALEILNVVVFFQDQPQLGYRFTPERIQLPFQPPPKGEVLRRLDYLRGATKSDLSARKRPNVLLILADDLGYSDLGCYGGEIQTPNLNGLARGGVRFTQFYNTARCWPTRAALLTGFYAQQVRRDTVPGIASGGRGVRPEWAPLLAERLQQTGYRTYHSGKWHIDGMPLENGFDRSYYLQDQGRFFNPRVHYLDDQRLPAVEPGSDFYGTIAIADHAVRCLREHAENHPDRPFFHYLAFTAPHFPLHALPEDIARYRDTYQRGWKELRDQRWRRIRELGLVQAELSPVEREIGPPYDFPEAIVQLGPGETNRPEPWEELTAEQREFQATKMAIHAAMVDRMDQEIGRVLEQLRASGTLENTLILFLSDNGASAEIMVRDDGHDPAAPPGSAASYLCLGPGWSTVANTPFRRHKTWVHEGGIATPLIAHWPAGMSAAGRVTDEPGHVIDLVPTILELAEVSLADSRAAAPPLPGASLLRFLRGQGADVDESALPPRTLWWLHEGNRAIRVGDWKLVAAKGEPWELYDLSRDRTETDDLAAEHPEKVRELEEQWTEMHAQFTADAVESAVAR